MNTQSTPGTPSMMQRWVNQFPDVSLDKILFVFRLMQEHYDEPGRYYHIFAHPEDMLRQMDQHFPDAPRAVVLAIFLHDVIYQPRLPYSELHSARFAREHLPKLDVPRVEVGKVARMIAATKDHIAQNVDQAIVCDLDLVSLAYSPKRYQKNTARIRREYGMYSDEQWNMGRQRFAGKILAREHIYATPEFQKFEAKARQNLEDEIAAGATS